MTPNENAGEQAGVGVTGCQAEATLQNVGLHYEPLGNLVVANLAGQRAAAILLNELQSHYADPDAIYLALKLLMTDGCDIEKLAALRGFCRAIQKQIERAQT